ncbi:thioesterase family protein [Citricoccus sp. NPDC055426]|uniref:acyl-CoA thioesterase n=1 Tax=Citricoccus sp. NPDC055426 TaxID=3155536 RepID=UPI0034405ED3
MSTPYEIEMDLRWSDQDAQGHVNNAKIVTLAEEGRIRFHTFLASRRQGGGESGSLVVARQEIDYHAQTRYAPSITLRVSVVRIGTKSYTLRQQGIQGGEPVFTVDSILVRLDGSGASRALTEQERKELAAWSWPEEQSSA